MCRIEILPQHGKVVHIRRAPAFAREHQPQLRLKHNGTALPVAVDKNGIPLPVRAVHRVPHGGKGLRVHVLAEF